MVSPCSFCLDRKLECIASSESERCLECVRSHQSLCEAKGVSPQDLKKIGGQFSKLESQVREVDSQLSDLLARSARLHKQKDLWSKKMLRAIQRGIHDVEELDRVEAEEAAVAERERLKSLGSGPAPSDSAVDVAFFDLDAVDWSALEIPSLEVGQGSGGGTGSTAVDSSPSS